MADLWLVRAKIIVQAAISAIVLVSALYVILSGSYTQAAEAWAAGAVGVVIGYWLR